MRATRQWSEGGGWCPEAVEEVLELSQWWSDSVGRWDVA